MLPSTWTTKSKSAEQSKTQGSSYRQQNWSLRNLNKTKELLPSNNLSRERSLVASKSGGKRKQSAVGERQGVKEPVSVSAIKNLLLNFPGDP